MFSTVEKAENHFYYAFTNCDIEEMMAVWLDSKEASCIHPGGAVLIGTSEIRLSWQQIFSQTTKRFFSIKTINQLSTENLCLRIVQENIHLKDPNFIAPPVYATNLYKKLESSWFMALHHASVSPVKFNADNQSFENREKNKSDGLH